MTNGSPLLLLGAIASACTLAPACDALPKNARGQTPIRYVVCDAQGHDCHVAARFEDLHSCERYRPFASAHCDSEQAQAKLICDLSEPTKTTSYCVP